MWTETKVAEQILRYYSDPEVEVGLEKSASRFSSKCQYHHEDGECHIICDKGAVSKITPIITKSRAIFYAEKQYKCKTHNKRVEIWHPSSCLQAWRTTAPSPVGYLGGPTYMYDSSRKTTAPPGGMLHPSPTLRPPPQSIPWTECLRLLSRLRQC